MKCQHHYTFNKRTEYKTIIKLTEW